MKNDIPMTPEEAHAIATREMELTGESVEGKPPARTFKAPPEDESIRNTLNAMQELEDGRVHAGNAAEAARLMQNLKSMGYSDEILMQMFPKTIQVFQSLVGQ
jgi:hypothetical protein